MIVVRKATAVAIVIKVYEAAVLKTQVGVKRDCRQNAEIPSTFPFLLFSSLRADKDKPTNKNSATRNTFRIKNSLVIQHFASAQHTRAFYEQDTRGRGLIATHQALVAKTAQHIADIDLHLPMTGHKNLNITQYSRHIQNGTLVGQAGFGQMKHTGS